MRRSAGHSCVSQRGIDIHFACGLCNTHCPFPGNRLFFLHNTEIIISPSRELFQIPAALELPRARLEHIRNGGVDRARWELFLSVLGLGDGNNRRLTAFVMAEVCIFSGRCFESRQHGVAICRYYQSKYAHVPC